MRKILSWLKFWHSHEDELMGISGPFPDMGDIHNHSYSIFLYRCKTCQRYKDKKVRGSWKMPDKADKEIAALEKMIQQ